MKMKTAGITRLQALKERSLMFAITKEAFVVYVGCALEQVGVPNPYVAASRIAFGHHGARVDVSDLQSMFTEEWAGQIVDQALALVHNQAPPAPFRIFTEAEYQADAGAVVAHAAATGGATVVKEDGTPRLMIAIPHAEPDASAPFRDPRNRLSDEDHEALLQHVNDPNGHD